MMHLKRGKPTWAKSRPLVHMVYNPCSGHLPKTRRSESFNECIGLLALVEVFFKNDGGLCWYRIKPTRAGSWNIVHHPIPIESFCTRADPGRHPPPGGSRHMQSFDI